MENENKSSKKFKRNIKSLIGLTTDSARLNQIFSCIICQMIPNPLEQVKICKHANFSCSTCFFEEEAISFPCLCTNNDLETTDNRHLANILKNSYWHCQNRRFGCNLLISGNHLSHLSICKFKPYFECHYKQCSEITESAAETMDHLMQFHDNCVFDLKAENGYIVVSFDFDSGVPEDQYGLLKYEDNHFMLSFEFIDEIVYTWIWDLNTDLEKRGRRSMKYMMTIEPVKKNHGVIEFPCDCVPYFTSVKSVIEEGNCFALPIRHFRNKYLDGKMSFKEEKILWYLNINVQIADTRRNLLLPKKRDETNDAFIRAAVLNAFKALKEP